VTEKNAHRTIQDLEIRVAGLEERLGKVERVLKDADLEASVRVKKAVEILSVPLVSGEK